MEFKSQKELYLRLRPAFNVKLRLFKNEKYYYITKEDIWNYLKISKWKNSYGLSLADMAHDIIHVNGLDIEKYLKDKLKDEEKQLILESEDK